MIKVNRIKKSYTNGTYALAGVSFKIDKKITSIIGRNGAGKTTLMRILSTQLTPSSGTASINGYDILKDANKIRKIIVSIPQEARPIYYHNVLDSVRLYLSARGLNIEQATKRAEKALRQVGLWEVKDEVSNKLSGGMKRKIFVAMVLASEADIIFLDEPTTALDPISRLEVWSAIKLLKGQTVLTTHYMEEAQALSDEVIMIDKGKILAQGKPTKLLSQFEGMVRVESRRRYKNSYKVANTYVSYIKSKQAESFILKGDIVKPVTLDDLFIKKGVNLES